MFANASIGFKFLFAQGAAEWFCRVASLVPPKIIEFTETLVTSDTAKYIFLWDLYHDFLVVFLRSFQTPSLVLILGLLIAFTCTIEITFTIL